MGIDRVALFPEVFRILTAYDQTCFNQMPITYIPGLGWMFEKGHQKDAYLWSFRLLQGKKKRVLQVAPGHSPPDLVLQPFGPSHSCEKYRDITILMKRNTNKNPSDLKILKK